MTAAARQIASPGIRRLTPAIGAELTGVDFSRDIDDATFDAVYEAFLEYGVLLFGVQDPGRL